MGHIKQTVVVLVPVVYEALWLSFFVTLGNYLLPPLNTKNFLGHT